MSQDTPKASRILPSSNANDEHNGPTQPSKAPVTPLPFPSRAHVPSASSTAASPSLAATESHASDGSSFFAGAAARTDAASVSSTAGVPDETLAAAAVAATRSSPSADSSSLASRNHRNHRRDDDDDDAKSYASSSASAATDATVSDAASHRQRYGAIELSLPTQRRLIRKPLPDLPGAEPRAGGGAARPLTAKARAAQVLEQQRDRARQRCKADEWWPTQLPDHSRARHPAPSATAPPTPVPLEGLDHQSRQHLRSILLHAAADPIAARHNSNAPRGRGIDEGAHVAQPLPRELQAAMYAAVLELLCSLSEPDLLASLQRTAAMRWRAEATMQAAAQAAAAATAAAAAASSSSSAGGQVGNLALRLARLAWPMTAIGLGRNSSTRQEVQMSEAAARHAASLLDAAGTSKAAGIDGGGGSGSTSSSGLDVIDAASEQRMRKRDVAIKILSNAVWLARTYGGGNLMSEVLYGSAAAAAAQEAADVAAANGTAKKRRDDSPASVNAGAHSRDDAPAGPETALAHRKPAAAPANKRGPPQFIKVSAPTTALSQAAPGELSPPREKRGAAIEDGAQAMQVSTAEDASREGVKSTAAAATPATVRSPDPASRPTTPTPSKAFERLSSLSQAAGAAAAAQLKSGDASSISSSAIAGSDATLPSAASSRRSSASTAARPRLSTTSSLLLQSAAVVSEAERAETEALEKAEREWRARVGKGCEEWAKMSVCKVCVRVEQGAATQLPQQSAVVWQPGVFEGRDLFDGSAPTLRRADEDEAEARAKLVGGTLLVKMAPEVAEDAAIGVLQTTVYAGCAMLLELSLLADVGHARPQPGGGGPKRALSLPHSHRRGEGGGAAVSRANSTRRRLGGLFGNLGHTAEDDSEDQKAALARQLRSSRRSSLATSEDGGKVSSTSLSKAIRLAAGRVREASTETITPLRTGVNMPRSITLGLPRSTSIAADESKEQPQTEGLSQPATPSSRPAAGGAASGKPTKASRIGRLIHFWSSRTRGISDAPTPGAAMQAHTNDTNGRPPPTSPTKRTSIDSGGPTAGGAAEAAPYDPYADWPTAPPPGAEPLCTSPDLVGSATPAVDGEPAFLHAFRNCQLLESICDVAPESQRMLGAMAAQRGRLDVAGIPSTPGRSSTASPMLLGTPARPLPPGIPGAGGGASSPWQRDTTVFYEKLGDERDVPLGQVLERMVVELERIRSAPDAETTSAAAAAAAATPRQDRDKTNGRARGAAAAAAVGLATADAASPLTRTVNYIVHGKHVTITAMLGAPSANASPELPSTLHEGSRPDSLAAGPSGAKGTQATDITAVAAALHTDQDAAATAFAAAETAIRAVEGAEDSTGVDADAVAQDGGRGAHSSATTALPCAWTWIADVESGEQSEARPLSHGSYLLSFAKYLELVAHHPVFQSPCSSSGTPGADADGDLKDVRCGRLQLFKVKDALVKVYARPLRIFELEIDGPVVREATAAQPSSSCVESEKGDHDDRPPVDPSSHQRLQEETRLDIQRFFASVKTHITAMEQIFVARELDEKGRTVKPASSNGSATPALTDTHQALMLLTKLKGSVRKDEFDLYEALRMAEVGTLNDVRKAFGDRLKSARKRLHAWSHKHLTKAEVKQLGTPSFDEPEYAQKGRHTFPGSSFVVREDEPLSIIAFSLSSRDYRSEVRAHTMDDGPAWAGSVDDDSAAGGSTGDRVLDWRKSIVAGAPHASQISTGRTSLAESLDRRSNAAPGAPLDPDRDEVFHDSEPVRVRMKRKKRGREASILSLTLRRVGSSVSSHSEAHSAASNSTRQVSGPQAPATPANARLSKSGAGAADVAGLELASSSSATSTDASDAEASDVDPSTPVASRIVSTPKVLDSAESNVDATSESYQSGTISSTATDSTFHAEIKQVQARPQSLATMFTPENPDRKPASSSERTPTAVDMGAGAGVGGEAGADHESLAPPSTPSAKGSSLWPVGSGFTRRSPAGENGTPRAASYAASDAERGSAARPSTGSKATSAAAARRASRPSAESPHIKHVLFHGTTKVSCVSWFAEEFASLRARWGVESGFAESLSRCNAWQAVGGKSKSAFFKTADERWIAKQLLTVWSVDEKEAFLEFAPAYLRYMMNSAVNQCPTLLVKVAGVYSLKIKDTHSGEVKLRMNLIVLENLFYGDDGRALRFDLKGIRDRKVKAVAGNAPTSTAAAAGVNAGEEGMPPVWWDAEWIESFKPQAFVPEEQRALFLQAMNNDLHFLTGSNIMDFSLLVGVDLRPEVDGVEPPGDDTAAAAAAASRRIRVDEGRRPTLRVRIIDFVAAFTLAKQLESSSKKALKTGSAKEGVTILPPAEYAARFRSALEGYFTGCPGVLLRRREAGAGAGADAGQQRAGRGTDSTSQVHRTQVSALPAVL